MIDHSLPDTDAWTLYFSNAELPVLRHTAKALDDLRINAEQTNGRNLSSIILKDPLMTLRVLAYLADHRHKTQVTDVTTIERALMMIGMAPFFRDLTNLPIIEDQLQANPKALLGLLKVVNRTLKATHYAREWAIIRHDLDVDEITIATLLHDAAEILMWCFAPNLAIKVSEMQKQDRNLRSATAQHEVYGTTLHDLQISLVHAWRLPKLLVSLMDHTNSENPRVKNVALAIDLARHSAIDWNDLALPDDFKNIEEFLHISHESLIHKLGLDIDMDTKQTPINEPNQSQ